VAIYWGVYRRVPTRSRDYVVTALLSSNELSSDFTGNSANCEQNMSNNMDRKRASSSHTDDDDSKRRRHNG